MNNFTALKVNEPLPTELTDAINQYIEYLKTGERTVEDCYQMEVLTEINYCIREGILEDATIKQLKDYYIRGGIHKIVDT